MPQPMGQSWKSSREMKHLGMCLNCPIPWEVAILGNDRSPTWVEGLVDKLPPERVHQAARKLLETRRVGLFNVGGGCYDVYIHPLEKEQL
jgi:hypothetical protein